MNSWMGSHISAVIRSWGPPTQITTDGAGGHIYIWLPRPIKPPPATIQKRGVVRWHALLNQYEYVEETSPTQTLNETLQKIAIDIHNSSYKMFYVRPNGTFTIGVHNRINTRSVEPHPTQGDKLMKIPNLPFDGLTHQGISLYELNDYRKATAFFDKAIRKDNKAVVAYYYQGLSRYALGQFEKAIADYDIVIHLYADDEEVYVNRGIARIALEGYQTAIRDCDEAIRINPHNADAFEVRGTAKIKSGDIISGNHDIHKALQLRARWESGLPTCFA